MMKQLARKTRSLSIVPPAEGDVQLPLEMSNLTLREAFDGWLNSVSPAVLQRESVREKAASAPPRRMPVTSRDLIRVNRATVRESNDHRHWPPDVVQQFLTANVIKRK